MRRIWSRRFNVIFPPQTHPFEVGSEDIQQLGPDSFFVSASHATQKLRAQAELLAEADVPVSYPGRNR